MINHEGYTGPICVAIVLIWRRDTNQVLLSLRKGQHGDMMWQIPGGKIDAWETPKQAGRREAWEEVGLKIEDFKILPYWSDERFPAVNRQYLCLYMVTEWDGQTPTNVEPEKSQTLQWWDWDDMPGNSMSDHRGLAAKFPDLGAFFGKRIRWQRLLDFLFSKV